MSLFDKIAAFFRGGSSRNVMIVDGDRMAGGDRVGPGERFQALSRLARYASREEITAKVVFGGRPLREAGEGEEFNGVQVFYAETEEEARVRLSKLVRSNGRAVLVTSDQTLEADMMTRGVATMRLSTLRKAMETGTLEGGGREGGGMGRGEGGGREGGGMGRGGDRDGGRRGRGRGRRRGDRRPRQDEGGSEQPADGTAAAPRTETSGSAGGGSSGADSSVKNLIDLVE